ncbi:MAG: helix-turn-helix domain-containing protein [Candidatus Thermoplasmatota archaeon]|jgi:DNA-binding HxlR family transcriptional regulator|nr:helix-turn-helix domain-containing protein [Candidatus Thermoplasmatota archaeon]MDP7265338.1 helix-turn-helix domain-containing protein [Candidatus Thermoplasmatota archaeon]MEE1551587.1 helix-turn-helix domain-containing protein [Nitrospinaceae bacterium]
MDEDCTVYKTVDLISKKWTLLIILELFRGEKDRKRYSEIKRSIPRITPKILSERLKELAEENVLRKEIDYSEIPIKTFYSLTERGKDLVQVVQSVKKWGLKWKFENEDCSGTYCEKCEL